MQKTYEKCPDDCCKLKLMDIGAGNKIAYCYRRKKVEKLMWQGWKPIKTEFCNKKPMKN